ncbi:hypothetical protein O0L34_g2704 [Tuta absoluta]|nr:hypothetical protein O0L34_g2704 [Tuta absoluta]
MSRKRKACSVSVSDDSRRGDFSPDENDDDYRLPQSEESSSEGDEEELPLQRRNQRRHRSNLPASPVESENIFSEEEAGSRSSINLKDCDVSDSSDEILTVRRRPPQCRNKHLSDGSLSNEESPSGEEEEEIVEPEPKIATSSNNKSSRQNRDEAEENGSDSSDDIFIQRRPSRAPPRPEAIVSAPNFPSQEQSHVASPDQISQGASPDQRSQVASPDEISQAASPDQRSQAASPDEIFQAASPGQRSEAASPNQRTQAATPDIDVEAISNLNSPANNGNDSPSSRPTTPLLQEEEDWIDVDSNDDETPSNFPFTADPGFKFQSPGPSKVSEMMDLFFTDDFIELIVAQTNLYAMQNFYTRNLRRHSRLKAWKDTDLAEMRVFLGLLLHMGTVNLPSLEHYWKKDELYYMPLFSGIMSRNRFQMILRYLHFTDNEDDDGSPLYKLQSVLDHFNTVMSEIYTPYVNICIDESMMLWRGRLVFRQYIKNKKHKYGIKLYKLCESNGIVIKIRIYTGKTNESNLRGAQAKYNHSTQIVMDLLQGYLDQGYKLFTDNFYNSVLLAKLLTERSTYICGTLRKNRKGNPKGLLSTKLNKGQLIAQRKDKVYVCNWKDKREVLCISNMHKPILVPVTNKNNKVSMKPNVVRDYNEGMSGIDLSDQMLSYYSALRKTLFWYKKLAIHIFEIYIHNACMIYNNQAYLPRQEKLDALSFKDKVIEYLLGEKLAEYKKKLKKMRDTNDDNQTFHYLERLPPTQKKQKPTKPCRVCTKEKKRRETIYYCPVCPEKPALCVENCFKLFHSFMFST